MRKESKERDEERRGDKVKVRREGEERVYTKTLLVKCDTISRVKESVYRHKVPTDQMSQSGSVYKGKEPGVKV